MSEENSAGPDPVRKPGAKRKFFELHKCDGCGLMTNRRESYMELIKAAGKISCCPERRIITILCEEHSP